MKFFVHSGTAATQLRHYDPIYSQLSSFSASLASTCDNTKVLRHDSTHRSAERRFGTVAAPNAADNARLEQHPNHRNIRNQLRQHRHPLLLYPSRSRIYLLSILRMIDSSHVSITAQRRKICSSSLVFLVLLLSILSIRSFAVCSSHITAFVLLILQNWAKLEIPACTGGNGISWFLVLFVRSRLFKLTLDTDFGFHVYTLRFFVSSPVHKTNTIPLGHTPTLGQKILNEDHTCDVNIKLGNTHSRLQR